MANTAKRQCSGTNARGERCRSLVVNAAGYCVAHDPEGTFDAKALGKASGKARRRPNPERVHESLRTYLKREVPPERVWQALEAAMLGSNESARVSAARVLLDALHEEHREQDRVRELEQAAAEAREYVRVKVDAIARRAHADGQAELAQGLEQAAHELWSETKLPDPVVVGDVSPSECAAILEGLAQRGLIRPPLQPGEVEEVERLREEVKALRSEMVA